MTALLKDPASHAGAAWQLSGNGNPMHLADPVPPQDPVDLARGKFCFIGQTIDFDGSPDWTAAGHPRLWQYNLQYFDWLWSLLPAVGADWDAAKRLTRDWIEKHPPRKDACGWEPYPTSLRLMNWCLLFGRRHHERLAADPGFCEAVMESIGRQAAWLEQNLETHIQANHLLENICALMCVASVLQGEDRDGLHRRMLPRLQAEIEEQILPDGMHYERSPMYHLRVMWLLEMLAEIGNGELRAIVEHPLDLSKQALSCLRHPDGGIAQFNDAVLGIYQDSWPKETPDGPWSLPEAGYYGYRSGGDYLIADGGAVGPDHQPGHAHADLLAFELSLDGQRVITDTGISTYEAGIRRSFDRSTAAHSTVEIAGQDSVEVWGGFRVGRRVVPQVLRWEPRNDGCLIEAEHAGYRHLAGSPLQRRQFEWRGGELEIRDRVSGQAPLPVAVRFHLAPGVEARLQDGQVNCRLGELCFVLAVEGQGDISIEFGNAYPHFGVAEERMVVVIQTRLAPPDVNWKFTIRRI